MTIIDAWMQHPTQRFIEQPMFAPLLRWTKQTRVPEVPVEATVATMNQAGVAMGLLSAWHGPQGALISNDEVAGFMAQAPGRFAGLASVDLHRPMDAVRELRRCVRSLDFKGLRILPWLWNLPPDDRRYYPLYAECIELGIPFCTQIGHTGPLCPSEPGRPIPYLEHVALEFPELTIVAGHLGAPWEAEAISLAHKFPNVYLDTSAYKAKRFPETFVRYLRGPGAGKVLFGSNFPMLTAQACLEGLEALALDAQTAAQYLAGNAATVFGLDLDTA